MGEIVAFAFDFGADKSATPDNKFDYMLGYPMSGDVTRIDGTTTLLMDELARVSDVAMTLPGADGRLALVGHSMASDIVVRQAIRDPRVQAVVALTVMIFFSNAFPASSGFTET